MALAQHETPHVQDDTFVGEKNMKHFQKKPAAQMETTPNTGN